MKWPTQKFNVGQADINYREGKNNIRADMLSHLHCSQTNPEEVKTNYVEPQQGTVTWSLPLDFDWIDKEQLVNAHRAAFTVEWEAAGDPDNEDYGFEHQTLLHHAREGPNRVIPPVRERACTGTC